MVSFKVTSLLFIFLLIHHSLAVLNNFGNKNENIDVKRTLCVGEDVIHGNDETEPIVVAAENTPTIKVNKITGSLEERTSSLPSEFELPLLTYNNQVPIFSPTNSLQSFELPEIFSPQSINSFQKYRISGNSKRILDYGTRYTPAFPPYRKNQMKLLTIHTIPTSLEAYGPPINKPIRYFSSSSSSTLLSKEHQAPVPIQIKNIHGDLSSNVGIFAPPTPPDIKYDGWKPIPGHISPPNHLSAPEQSTNIHAISSSTNNNFAQLPTNEIAHSSRQLSEFPTAIPSNSYGEPINNPEDHSLKQSVRQSHTSDGLPPQKIPEHEPFHVNQGPTTMIFSTNTPSIANNINDNHHNELESIKLPNVNDDKITQGLFHQSDGQLKNSNIGYPSGNDLLVSQLPPFSAPLTSFSSGPDDISTSYLAPPLSSYSSTGPYPSSRHPLQIVEPFRNQFKLMNNNDNRNSPKFIHSRSRGSIRPPLIFPIAPPISNLIPPRNAPLVNFRQSVSSKLPSKLIYNNYPSLIMSGIYDSAIDNSFIKNYHSLNFDSHGSPSSSQLELLDIPINHKPDLENTEQINEIDRDKLNYKFQIKVNDDVKSSSDNFGDFHNGNSETAQALAQALVSEDASSDSIQIQSSKDSYTLQIESENSGQVMENVDGTINHDKILSEKLLHDIISAIEQPGDAENIQIVSNLPVQSFEETHEHSEILSPPDSSQHSTFHNDDVDGEQAASQIDETTDSTPSNYQEDISLLANKNNAALFFNNHYKESINNKIISTFDDEKNTIPIKNNETNINL